MKIRIFYPNKNGKVEFSKEELEYELQKAYDEGFRDGKGYYPWSITYGNNNNGLTYKTTTDVYDNSVKNISNSIDSNCCSINLKSCDCKGENHLG